MKGEIRMKKLKTYIVDGDACHFDGKQMQVYVNHIIRASKRNGKKMTVEDIVIEISKTISVTTAAVHNYLYCKNGPADIDQVKKIADYLGVEYRKLLKMEEKDMTAESVEVKESGNEVAIKSFGITSEAQTQYTKEICREIYKTMVDYLDALQDWYYTKNPSEDKDPYDPEYRNKLSNAYDIAAKHFEKADRLIVRNLLDIPTDLYDSLKRYLWSDMISLENELTDRLDNPDNYKNKNGYVEDYPMGILIDDEFPEQMRKLFKNYIPE